MIFRLIYLLFVVANGVIVSTGEIPCQTALYQSGVCVSITDCPEIERAWENIKPGMVSNLRQYLSHFYCRDNVDKVCCPRRSSSHRNSFLLTRNRCGIPQDPPHEEHVARVNEFPWMALLVYNSATRPYQCGGSIITERYVLTAASCVTHELSRVRVGEHTISTDRDCQFYMGIEYCAPNYQEFYIESTIIHKHYDSADITNNIALLRLSGSIDLTQENVMPICLPLGEMSQATPTNGKNVTLIGWPLVGKNEQTDVLLTMKMTVVGNEACESRYRSAQLQSYLDEAKMMCAAANKSYPCRRNTGAPLLALSTFDDHKRYVQYGIASHGAPSCDGKLPEIYISVSTYMNWILNYLQP